MPVKKTTMADLTARRDSLHNASGVRAASGYSADQMAAQYAKCLLFPYNNACRIPTAHSNKSSLIRSKRTFHVEVGGTEAGAFAGRFAFFVQPKLGDAGNPVSYQIGYVNMLDGGVTTLNDAAAYITGPNDDKSLTIDPNSPWVTQPPPSALGLSVTGVTATQLPLSGATPWIPNAALGPITFNQSYQLYDGVGTWATQSILRIKPGSYLLSVATSTSAVATVDAPMSVVISAGNGTDKNVGVLTLLSSTGLNHTTQVQLYSLLVTESDAIRFGVVAANTITSARIILTPLCSPNYNWSANYGMTEMVRPVACSVLATCVLPSWKNGGLIASSLLPPGSQDKIMGSTDWLDLEKFTSANEYHRGELKHGSYVWWKPSGYSDTAFKTIEDSNAYQFPMMAFCGYTAEKEQRMTVLEVTVESVFEILQNTQLLDSKNEVGSTDTYERSLRGVARLNSATENPKHSTLLQDIGNIMSEGAKFLPLLSMIL